MTTESTNAVAWFELPVEDVSRAVGFYETVLGCEFTLDESISDTYPMFTTPDGELYGALNLAGEYPVGEEGTPVSYAPGKTGILLYLAVDGDLNEVLAAVEPAGGEVLVGTHESPDGSVYAIINDTEGNRLGLISKQVTT